MIVALVGGLVGAGCAAPAPAPGAPAPAEVINWKMQFTHDPSDPVYDIGRRFAERVTTMSNGQLNIDYYPGGALVPAMTEGEALRVGTIDIAMTNTAQYQATIPESALFYQMSGGLTSVQLAYWYLAGDGMDFMRASFNPMGIYPISYFVVSGEDWAYTKEPLNTLDDIKKLKMRTAGDGGEILSRMGAATVFLPGAELYESMQRGVINAFEYIGAMGAWDMGFHEVITYLYVSYTRAASDGSGFDIALTTWNELPEHLQTMLTVAGEAEIVRRHAEIVVGNAEAMVKIEDYGVIVELLPKEIADAYTAEAMKFYDEKAAGDPAYGAIVASQRKFKELMESQGIY